MLSTPNSSPSFTSNSSSSSATSPYSDDYNELEKDAIEKGRKKEN